MRYWRGPTKQPGLGLRRGGGALGLAAARPAQAVDAVKWSRRTLPIWDDGALARWSDAVEARAGSSDRWIER